MSAPLEKMTEALEDLAVWERAGLEHEAEVEYVTMQREVDAEKPKTPVPDQDVFHRMINGKRVKVEIVTVPKDRVAALEADGWGV